MHQPPSDVSIFWMVLVLVLFLIKHLVADFLLQTDWMARGKEARHGWLPPLAAHVAIHAGLTTAICLYAAAPLWWLGAVDFVVHFAIDRTKSIVSQRLELDPSNGGFWRLLGLDQTLHHATHIVFTIAIVTAYTVA